ncbi:hypothetical protein [Sporichthya sp.]|uniref:hypothetical protein n=1 Tax=Sporichthya sp. TaxID=65475 RepID=UPI0017F55DF8|nr:hypothetical protein [Sporichthya sp.]MBA3744092.1 hypothetical protein [Sporichthya sp.]
MKEALHVTALTLDATGRHQHVVPLLDAAERGGFYLTETPGGTLPCIAEAVDAARRRAIAAGVPRPAPDIPTDSLDEVLALALDALDQSAQTA